MYKLEDFASITMGQSPDSATYNKNGCGLPFFQGNADFGKRYPTVKGYCEMPKKTANPGDILISVRAPIGAVNIADQACCIGRGVAAITPKRKEDLLFIFYLLKAKRKLLESMGTGSTFKAIGRKALAELPFPQITESDRVHIGNILDKLDRIHEAKDNQISFLEEMVKSRFIELFGRIDSNEKGWPVGVINDVVSDVRYGTSRPATENGKFPYLRMNNITYSGELDLTNLKTIDIPDNELDKCSVRRGDVLFNRTNSKELVGKTCVFDRNEQMVLAGFIIRIRTNGKILPEFLSDFLNTDSSKRLFVSMCKKASGQANINANELKNIRIFIPSLEIQRRYVLEKGKAEKSKLAIQKSIDQLELLKKKLMQEYFG